MSGLRTEDKVRIFAWGGATLPLANFEQRQILEDVSHLLAAVEAAERDLATAKDQLETLQAAVQTYAGNGSRDDMDKAWAYLCDVSQNLPAAARAEQARVKGLEEAYRELVDTAYPILGPNRTMDKWYCTVCLGTGENRQTIVHRTEVRPCVRARLDALLGDTAKDGG